MTPFMKSESPVNVIRLKLQIFVCIYDSFDCRAVLFDVYELFVLYGWMIEEGGVLNVLGWFMVLVFFIFLYAVTINAKHDSFGMFS